MSWLLPHKPADMDLSCWSALLSRSRGECELDCLTQCDQQLEVDHINSRALGGETSLANCRLICKKANRERGMAHDSRYEKDGYFDNNFNLANLRITQQVVGAGSVQAHGDIFLGDKRKELLESVSLFALTCGAGKTVLMVAVLFKICEEVKKRMKYAPRPKHVLWFSRESDLCAQLKRELLSEITKFGLCDIRPNVRHCDETGDLDTDPGDHHFTVSCPHVLWQ